VSRLMKEITRRFTPMANISILVLVATGIVIVYYEKNFTGFLDFNNPRNIIMLLKHFLVALMIVIHFYRGLILNPRIGKLSCQINELQAVPLLSFQVAKLQKFSLDLVKTNLILGMIVLLLTGISSSL
ncbi:MAG: CopD family protein, partial [Actinobacteria bacterium]|nr:CopD family protein [Actinomycetota bacterium]